MKTINILWYIIKEDWTSGIQEVGKTFDQTAWARAGTKADTNTSHHRL